MYKDHKHEYRNWISPNKSPIRHIKYKNIIIHNKTTEKMRENNKPILN